MPTTTSASEHASTHSRELPRTASDVATVATVAMSSGIRYSTLGAWSHWLAASSDNPAAAAHHVHRADGRRSAISATSTACLDHGPERPDEMSQLPAVDGVTSPRRLKLMHPSDVADAIQLDPRLIVPVGTCEQHGPHMPLGADSIIVERLADDLSIESGVLVAPTVEYGVNVITERGYAGNASLRKKTLHRVLNDLIDTWESTGIREFILLTSHEHDPHLEALSTVITSGARVRVVDVLSVDFSDLLDGQDEPMHGDEVDTSLLLYVAPELVDQSRAQDYMMSRERGATLQTRLAARPASESGVDRSPVAGVRGEGSSDLPKDLYPDSRPDIRGAEGRGVNQTISTG